MKVSLTCAGAWLPWLGWLVGACGSTPSEIVGNPPDWSAGMTVADADIPDGPPDGPFTGTWAQLQVVSEVYTVPVLGNDIVHSIALLRVDVQDWEDIALLRFEVCHVEVDNESGVETRIPEALVAALEPYEAVGLFQPSGDGFSVQTSPVLLVRGAQLTDPANEPLPLEADDPRVIDVEGDGQPGFTIFIDIALASGNVYMVQRQSLALDGFAPDTDHFDGTIAFSNEQHVIGSDHALLDFDPERSLQPGDDNQFFRTTRIDAEMDCPAITSGWRDLFAAEQGSE